jgi:hypothetical protein
MSECVKVVVRCRPMNDREKDLHSKVLYNQSQREIIRMLINVNYNYHFSYPVPTLILKFLVYEDSF